MSDRAFHPDTNDVSSTTPELGGIADRLNRLTLQFATGRIRRGGRFNEAL